MVSGAHANGQPDRVSFAPAEPLDKPDDPVGHSVLLLQKREDAFGGSWFDYSSLSVDPCALDGASRVTRGDANSWVVSDPLYLSSTRISANEPFSTLFDAPDSCADCVSGFPVSLGAGALLSSGLGNLALCRTPARWRHGRPAPKGPHT